MNDQTTDGTINAACGSCGAHFQLPKEYALKRVKCPKCDSVFQVPPVPPKPDSIPPFAQAIENPRGQKREKKHPTRKWIFVGCLVILMVPVAWYAWSEIWLAIKSPTASLSPSKRLVMAYLEEELGSNPWKLRSWEGTDTGVFLLTEYRDHYPGRNGRRVIVETFHADQLGAESSFQDIQETLGVLSLKRPTYLAGQRVRAKYEVKSLGSWQTRDRYFWLVDGEVVNTEPYTESRLDELRDSSSDAGRTRQERDDIQRSVMEALASPLE